MAMKHIRGFRIRLKLVERAIHRQPKPSNYAAKAMSILCKFGRSMKKSAKGLCSPQSGSNYIRVGQENPVGKTQIPKGHLAVYVGEKEDDAHRVLMPVIYFNHPLFEDFLRKAEKVYGFNHRGGIHVPCRISEFENIQTMISNAGGCGGGGGRTRRSWRLTL